MDEPQDSGMYSVSLTLNGAQRTVTVHFLTTLLILLREHVGLNGTKIGCGHGQCGACTVLIDGERRLSCLTLAVAAHGKMVTSIEGLAADGQLDLMQQCFLRREAFQCGYCTSGQILSAVAVAQDAGVRTRDEIVEAMSGNLCRCGTYEHIVEAIQDYRAAKA